VDVFVALGRGEPTSLASHGVDDPALWDILRRGLGPREGRWPSMRALREALTTELLSRGATRDIAGLALGAALPSDAPAPPSGDRLRPGWEARSGRFVRPSRAQLSSSVPPRLPSIEIEIPPALP